jgi:hypothetical protein
MSAPEGTASAATFVSSPRDLRGSGVAGGETSTHPTLLGRHLSSPLLFSV